MGDVGAGFARVIEALKRHPDAAVAVAALALGVPAIVYLSTNQPSPNGAVSAWMVILFIVLIFGGYMRLRVRQPDHDERMAKYDIQRIEAQGTLELAKRSGRRKGSKQIANRTSVPTASRREKP